MSLNIKQSFSFLSIFGLLILFRGYVFPETYNFLKLLLLLVYYLLFYITFGGIALFSQQIFFDYLKIYKNHSKYDNDDKEYEIEDLEKNMIDNKKEVNIEINEIKVDDKNDIENKEKEKLIDNNEIKNDDEQKDKNANINESISKQFDSKPKKKKEILFYIYILL